MSIPARIGRYRIVREIGRGAIGLVYLAHDPKIDRHVAIKTIHRIEGLPPAEADATLARFTREAQAASGLQHAGIVTIYDVGEQDGVGFIAMEYIEGETLERYTDKDRLLPLESVFDLAAQACEALDYAHRHNVVHRDIKPANLMLLRSGELKITDFGLARNPATNLTQDGILLGTPDYMSPEQVTGAPLDGRSDQFSLAAVLYEMLTGERPFPGDTVTTVIYRIVHESPRRPQLVNRRLPAQVGQALMRALEKDPARRFDSCGAMAAVLRSHASVAAMAPTAGMMAGPAWPGAHEDVDESDTQPMPAIRVGPRAAVQEAPARLEAPRAQVQAGAQARTQARPAAARGTLRGMLIAAAAVAIVLLVPAGAAKDDRWGRAAQTGVEPIHQTAALAPVGLPAAAGAPTKTILVKTEPPGGTIYFKDVEAEGGVIHLSALDAASHTVVAENDCFIDSAQVSASGPGTLTIPLKTPRVERSRVESTPAGAALSLDGRPTGLVTPAELDLTACEPHVLIARLDRHEPAELTIDEPGAPVTIALERTPEGTVTIASDYPVVVKEKGRRIGTGGGPIKLPRGRHTLTIVNDDLFVERTITVDVPANGRLTPRAGLPGIGRLTVLASPSNCMISINGKEIGPPPINELPLAEGTYTVRAVYLPTGEAKSASVTINRDASSRLPFRFSP